MGGLSLLFVIPCFLLVKGSGMYMYSACVLILLTMFSLLECKGQPSSWKILKTLGSNFIIILLRKNVSNGTPQVTYGSLSYHTVVANALAIAAISFLTPTLQPFLQQYVSLVCIVQ